MRKCDPAGRFWAGTMSLTEEVNAGNVYSIDSNLSPIKKFDTVTISNGMAWSLDHRTFYYIDTPTYEIAAYDYEKKSGNITNKRTVIQTAKEDGYPDGMTIDNEGMLWIAHWDGWQISRWHPDTGKQIHQIKLPVARVTSCTFGGNNFEDLYITSARSGLAEENLRQQPLAGFVFVIKNCGFKGLPAVEFKV